jgi:hypothetical protein
LLGRHRSESSQALGRRARLAHRVAF